MPAKKILYRSYIERGVLLGIFALFLVQVSSSIAQETSAEFTGGSVKIGYDNRVCDSTLSAVIRYNTSKKCAEFCNGSEWLCHFENTNEANFSDPVDCPNIGDLCADGSIYAGYHPTIHKKLYMHPEHQSVNTAWNNGTSNWVATGCNDVDDGQANTACLAWANDAGAPYQAAQLCSELDSLGYTDWYLPSQLEIYHLWSVEDSFTNGEPIIDTTGDYYWTSTESSSSGAKSLTFVNGPGSRSKNSLEPVRCLRRE